MPQFVSGGGGGGGGEGAGAGAGAGGAKFYSKAEAVNEVDSGRARTRATTSLSVLTPGECPKKNDTNGKKTRGTRLRRHH